MLNAGFWGRIHWRERLCRLQIRSGGECAYGVIYKQNKWSCWANATLGETTLNTKRWWVVVSYFDVRFTTEHEWNDTGGCLTHDSDLVEFQKEALDPNAVEFFSKSMLNEKAPNVVSMISSFSKCSRYKDRSEQHFFSKLACSFSISRLFLRVVCSTFFRITNRHAWIS